MWKNVWVVVLAAFVATVACARAEEPPTAAAPEEGAAPADRETGPRARPGRPVRDADGPVELGEFWLGVECYPVPPPLADQLGLAEQGGLLIEQVIPKSPAEQAGLKRYDVVVGAGGKPIAHIPELIAAVNEAGEEELTLDVVRGGKRREVTATPARRPREDRPRQWREPPRGEDLDRLWQWFGRMEPDADWQRPLRFHFFHPGAILPPGAELHPPLPDDMSVVIRKQGDQPTKITVERGDESWEVSGNALDELPDDVRPHVERMLGRFPVAGPGGMRILPRRPGEPDDPVPPEALEHHLERQIDEMNRRLEEMRRSLDRWRDEDQPPRPNRPNPGAA